MFQRHFFDELLTRLLYGHHSRPACVASRMSGTEINTTHIHQSSMININIIQAIHDSLLIGLASSSSLLLYQQSHLWYVPQFYCYFFSLRLPLLSSNLMSTPKLHPYQSKYKFGIVEQYKIQSTFRQWTCTCLLLVALTSQHTIPTEQQSGNHKISSSYLFYNLFIDVVSKGTITDVTNQKWTPLITLAPSLILLRSRPEQMPHFSYISPARRIPETVKPYLVILGPDILPSWQKTSSWNQLPISPHFSAHPD